MENENTSLVTTGQTQVVGIESMQVVAASHPEPVDVTALAPDEMAASQATLIEWFKRKIAACAFEHDELLQAHEHAVKHKWKSGTLKRHAAIAQKRLDFYLKILGALQAGYCIVPNFPVTMFAVRTDLKKPLKLIGTNRHQSKEQESACLPAGQGEYKNPFPVVMEGWRGEKRKNIHGVEEDVDSYWAEDWDGIEFPVNMAKPVIMEATTRAMALNIFDEFGVLPAAKRNVDPVVVGRIVQRLQHGDKVVSFMIAWRLNTATI